MKTQLLSCIILFFISFQSYSQRYKFELAAEGGPGFSRVWGDGSKHLYHQDALASFQTGIALRFNTPKIAGIGTGLYVERKGFSIPVEVPISDVSNVTYHYQMQYNYVTLPVMLNATFGHKVQFFVQVGGYISALFHIHMFCNELDLDQVNSSGYQYVDAGFAGGAGLKIPIEERLIFSFEARNATGFREITRNTNSDYTLHNLNTTFLAGIGYSFRQWKK